MLLVFFLTTIMLFVIVPVVKLKARTVELERSRYFEYTQFLIFPPKRVRPGTSQGFHQPLTQVIALSQRSLCCCNSNSCTDFNCPTHSFCYGVVRSCYRMDQNACEKVQSTKDASDFKSGKILHHAVDKPIVCPTPEKNTEPSLPIKSKKAQTLTQLPEKCAP